MENHTTVEASYAQLQVWIIDQLTAARSAYNVSTTVSLGGRLARRSLERAWTVVVDRHEVLRSSLELVDGRLLLNIHAAVGWTLVFDDVSWLPAARRQEEARRIVAREVQRPFELDAAPLWRLCLVKLSGTQHVMTLVLSHAVVDGWSLGIVKRELSAAYNAFLAGEDPCLAPSQVSYARASLEQRERIGTGLLEGDMRYWLEQLRDVPTLLLPFSRPRPAEQTFRGGREVRTIAPEIAGELEQLARRHRASLFMVLLTGFAIALSRCTGEIDIPIGTPTANRLDPDVDGIVGPFMNPVVLRVNVGGQASFSDVLSRVRETTLAALEHQAVPFGEVVRRLAPERTLTYNPLFQVMFALQNAESVPVRLNEVDVALLDIETGTTRFDLDWTLWRRETGLDVQVLYNLDVFERDTITSLIEDTVATWTEALTEPAKPIVYSGVREDARVLSAASVTRSVAECIHELFEEQVLRSPDAVALEVEDVEHSYAELDERANAIACELADCGVTPGARVGLCCRRSSDLVIALLGILKAGAAVVPLDARDPPERIRLVVDNVRASLVISDESASAAVSNLDRVLQPPVVSRPRPPHISASPEDVAYVIHTSGTSGRPKGVLVAHQNAAHTVLGFLQQFDVGPLDTFLTMASHTFDIFFLELLVPLVTGGRALLVTHSELFDPTRLLTLLHRGTCIQAVPGLMRQITHAVSELGNGSVPNLRYAFTGGDVVPPSVLGEMTRAFPNAEHWVLYGPTETSIVCAGYRVPRTPPIDRHPIGLPLPGVHLRLCQAGGDPALGTPGELWIGGGGVAQGYLADDADSRFAVVDGERFYRSGDICRFDAQHGLIFVGRADQQVKIRGIRVEPLEVEAVVASDPDVEEAAVSVEGSTSDDRALIAHVALAAGRRRPALEGELESELVRYWKDLFNDTHATPQTSKLEDFTGWRSSYTGRQIPEKHLNEWRDAIVARVLSSVESPTDLEILDVGCGTGLIAVELVDHCRRYVGTDLSTSVLGPTAARLRQSAPAADIEILEADALDVADAVSGSFDVVVLNSVAQYMPSAQYLRSVLVGLVNRTRPGGCVMIGDVRSLPLLEAFHVGVMNSRNELQRDAREAARICLRQRIAEEQELVLAPGFFHDMGDHCASVILVEAIPRTTRLDNEMSRYRYDVILHVGPRDVIELDGGLPWDALRTSGELARVLDREKPELLGIMNIPNGRVQEDVELLRALGCAMCVPDGSPTRPDAILTLAELSGYGASFNWSRGSRDGSFDVALKLNSSHGFRVRWPRSPDDTPTANQPTRALADRRHTDRIRGRLALRLPKHLVPRSIHIVDELPRTPNGKIDRQALRGRPTRSPRVGPSPGSATAKAVCAVWSEVLGGQELTMSSNFFAEGGTSLLAVQAAIQLRARGFDVTPQSIFVHQTVGECAAAIESGATHRTEDMSAVRARRVTGGLKATIPEARRGGSITAANTVLVTGATGFLGAHIVVELLATTNAEIACLVRAGDEQVARDRLFDALTWAGVDTRNENGRLKVLLGDLRDERLGLNKAAWTTATRCEHIVNVAADVRHIGDAESFRATNHVGTLRVLELAARGTATIVHHVSSIGVKGVISDGSTQQMDETVIDLGQTFLDPYSASKFAAELTVSDYRARGGLATIFRVGTVAPHSLSGAFQRNISDHFFTRYIRSIVSLGIAAAWPDKTFRLCPVDVVARSIVVAASQEGLLRHTFHIDSPHRLTHGQLVATLRRYGYEITLCPPATFADKAFKMAREKKLDERLDGVLSFIDSTSAKGPELDSTRSLEWFRDHGIDFPAPTPEWLGKFYDHCVATGFMPKPSRRGRQSSELDAIATCRESVIQQRRHRGSATRELQ